MSDTTEALALTAFPVETWGERLRRARGRRALEAVATSISHVYVISHTTIARLEKLTDKPTKLKQRRIAVLALLSYGYDPEDFGLSLDDLPSQLDLLGVMDYFRSRCDDLLLTA